MRFGQAGCPSAAHGLCAENLGSKTRRCFSVSHQGTTPRPWVLTVGSWCMCPTFRGWVGVCGHRGGTPGSVSVVTTTIAPPATPSIQTESPVASPSTPAPGLLSVLRQPSQLCAGWKGVAGRRAPTSYTAGGYLGAVLLPGATGMSTEPSPLSLLPEQTAVSFREGACPQLQGSAQTWGREVITRTFISSRRHLL